MDQLPWLDENNYAFPDLSTALATPNGLLALGGDLSPQRLIRAYQLGIFPWYEEGQPILWWSPDPRMVLIPAELHISKSLKKTLKKTDLVITFNQAFEQVIKSCSESRNDSPDTWITNSMMQAYQHLHKMGYAHSVEAWDNNTLVGGLYGLSIGKVFCGESMFSHQSNASKIAFVHLVQKLEQQGTTLIDCQVASAHLFTLGAKEISRAEFTSHLPLTRLPSEPHSDQPPSEENDKNISNSSLSLLN